MTDEYRFPSWQTRLLASTIVLAIAWVGAALITSMPRTVSQFDRAFAPVERATGQALHSAAGGSHWTAGQSDQGAATAGRAGCD
jgi:hypothetical protein